MEDLIFEILFLSGTAVVGGKLVEYMFRSDFQEWKPYFIFKQHVSLLQKNKYAFTKSKGIWKDGYTFSTKGNVTTYFCDHSSNYLFRFRCGYDSGFSFYYNPEKKSISGFDKTSKKIIPDGKEKEFAEFLHTYVALIIEKMEHKHHPSSVNIEDLFEQENKVEEVETKQEMALLVEDEEIQHQLGELSYLFHVVKPHLPLLSVEEQHQYEVYQQNRIPLLIEQYKYLTKNQQLEEKEELLDHLTLMYQQVNKWKEKVEEKNKQEFKKSLLLIKEDHPQ